MKNLKIRVIPWVQINDYTTSLSINERFQTMSAE